jgi:hypothetical protein
LKIQKFNFVKELLKNFINVLIDQLYSSKIFVKVR